jgi:hypothetical protein
MRSETSVPSRSSGQTPRSELGSASHPGIKERGSGLEAEGSTSMGVTGAFVGAITKAILDRVLSKTSKGEVLAVSSLVEAAIPDHLRDIANWSGKVQTLDATVPDDLSAATIHIGFDTEPRRFRSAKGTGSVRQEHQLLEGDEHYLLVGNPGSGKTTAIKRLIQHLLTQPANLNDDGAQFPLLVRLRELEQGQALHCALATILGLPYEAVELRSSVGATVVTRIEMRVMGEHIERVVARALSGTGAVILLDGLDEVWSDTRPAVAGEVARLVRAVAGAKVIVTSRTGEYGAPVEGATILQLCPLTRDQVHEIALKWLPDPTQFVQALERLPYRDIADRPLLLTQLLLLYKRYGFLPEQPAHVYKRVIRVLLEDWDAQRNIVRKSKYSDFDPDRKSEFLSAIAYFLTYTLTKSQFDEDALVRAYERVYEVFNLPPTDARQVAREIEAHTGIIVESGHETFEFSHLSIQEYLCANYIVRSGSPALVRRALSGHMAPLAIAVALSSQPSEWLTRLVLNPQDHAWLNVKSVVPFLSRLAIERPFFEAYEPLGWAAMFVFYRLYKEDGRLPEGQCDLEKWTE